MVGDVERHALCCCADDLCYSYEQVRIDIWCCKDDLTEIPARRDSACHHQIKRIDKHPIPHTVCNQVDGCRT